MTASVELHDVIAAKGMAPLSARLRSGEVVRIDGPRHAVSALLDVIAGRRAPRSGRVETRGGARVLVRDGERTAAGVEPGDAIDLWAALASSSRGPRTRDDAEVEDPAARGLEVASPVWLVDGALAPGAEQIVQRAAEAVRTGDGLMVWTGPSRSAGNDRVIVIDVDDHAGPRARANPAARRGGRARAATWPWRAALRFAAEAAMARSALAVAAVVTLWIAACAATVAAHEGFWFAPGSAGALDVVARLSAMGGIAIIATAAAARAAAAAAWPAMLRETGASPAARALALLAGDAGGAAFPAVAAALPAMWARDPLAAIVSVLAAIVAASAAATITRATRMW